MMCLLRPFIRDSKYWREPSIGVEIYYNLNVMGEREFYLMPNQPRCGHKAEGVM